MKRVFINWFTLACMLGSLLLISCQDKTVTMETLLDEMVDRENIARLPEIPFSLKQFSSYDRGSVAPDQPGWFANSDRTWFIREETNGGRKEYVMMDTTGPGAVVRIWMTFAGDGAGNGILRFYFDGDTEPAIEGTAFDVLSGGQLTGEPLASSVSDLSPYETRGHNLYLPLPYAKSCKITYESDHVTTPGNKGNTGESVYYNINYRTYPANIKVVTFDTTQLDQAAEKIASVQAKLLNRDKGLDRARLAVQDISGTLAAGEKRNIEIQGSSAIRYIRLKIDAQNLPQALRTTIVEAEFDGEKTVWCPAGDFFGTGYQIRHLNTWYAQVKEDGTMEAYWLMPFEKSATISFNNIGDQAVKLTGELGSTSWEWDNRSMHFGASWYQHTGIFTRRGLTKENPGEPFDVNYVELSGEGVFVGDGLTLFNTSYIWWGEGDEKIYTDGETFPSHFGTGTEDYYGYAWGGRSKRFSNHPFIAQPDESGNWKPGYVVNLRHRSLDVIPFKEHLKVDMELWHWHSTWVNYAPACFWYMRPGGTNNIAPDREGALAKVALHSTDIIPNRMAGDEMEAEHMAFHNSCGNLRGSMSINPFGEISLSNNLQVMWHDGMPGDSIFFSFGSPREGIFKLSADFTTGPMFGHFRCLLNGKEIHTGIDLPGDNRGTKQVSFGNIELKEGENTFIFIIKPGEGNRHLLGIDKINLSK